MAHEILDKMTGAGLLIALGSAAWLGIQDADFRVGPNHIVGIRPRIEQQVDHINGEIDDISGAIRVINSASKTHPVTIGFDDGLPSIVIKSPNSKTAKQAFAYENGLIDDLKAVEDGPDGQSGLIGEPNGRRHFWNKMAEHTEEVGVLATLGFLAGLFIRRRSATNPEWGNLQ